MKSTRKAALWYSSQGWPIIPIWPLRDGVCLCGSKAECESPGKHPIERFIGGRKVWGATTNQEQLNKWWNHIPDANLATPRWLRIDVDTKDNGVDNWRELLYNNGGIDGIVCLTPSGGQHYYFQSTKTHGNTNQEGDLPPGIDVRGNSSGYTLLPPSNHLNGRYKWGEKHPSKHPIPMPPDWLLDIIGPDERPEVCNFSGDLDKPDLSQWSLSGLVVGCITQDRSRIDQSVITSLARAGANDDEIRAIFKHYEIGTEGKYGEKNGSQPDKYLALSIAKARKWLAKSKPPERSQL